MSLHHPSPLPSLAATARKVSLQAQRKRVTPAGSASSRPGSKFGPSSGHDDRRLSMLGAVAETTGQRCNAAEMVLSAGLQAARARVFDHSLSQAPQRHEVGNRPHHSFVALNLHRQPRPSVEAQQ